MEGVPQSGELRKTCPWKLCERSKAQLELTFSNRSPTRSWVSTDILGSRWDPGIPSCSWWVTRPTKDRWCLQWEERPGLSSSHPTTLHP